MRIWIAALVSAIAVTVSTPAVAGQQSAGAPDTPPTATPDSQPDRTFIIHSVVVRVGQNYTVGPGEQADQVSVVLGDATIEGTVEHDVVVVLGSLKLASTARVDGSVVVVGGSAAIDAGASVRHDLVVIGGTLTAPPGFSPGDTHVAIGTIGVERVLQSGIPWVTHGLLWGRVIVPSLPWMWGLIGLALIVALALNLFFERAVAACAAMVTSRPLGMLMIGLLVLLLTLPVLGILAASVVGLLVVPFLICALIAGTILGNIGVARAVGQRVVAEPAERGALPATRSLLIGFALLCVAYMVPVVGLLAWALVGVLGIGAAAGAFRVAVRREQPARERKRTVPAVAPLAVEHAEIPVAPAVDATEVTEEPPPAPAALPRVAGDLTVYPRAGFFDRAAAFALDCILVAIAIQLLDLGRDDGWFPLLLLVYHIAFWAWRGTTLGGIIVGLRVVRVDGAPLRFVDALVRGLTSVFSLAALGIGCFWMLQDPERQTWHDKIAGTLVVRVPRHLVLP
jgi:uncharacterized RDD family membrane protein YckC